MFSLLLEYHCIHFPPIVHEAIHCCAVASWFRLRVICTKCEVSTNGTKLLSNYPLSNLGHYCPRTLNLQPTKPSFLPVRDRRNRLDFLSAPFIGSFVSCSRRPPSPIACLFYDLSVWLTAILLHLQIPKFHSFKLVLFMIQSLFPPFLRAGLVSASSLSSAKFGDRCHCVPNILAFRNNHLYRCYRDPKTASCFTLDCNLLFLALVGALLPTETERKRIWLPRKEESRQILNPFESSLLTTRVVDTLQRFSL